MSATASIPTLSRQTLWLMALACGVSVANICYNQPLLGAFAAEFHATPAQVGWVAMASQAGYGLGLLFFLPLGDIRERSRLVLTLVLSGAVALALTAFAPTLGALIALNLLVGAMSMSAQVLIPFAVELSPAEKRGHTIGVMMTGILGGILLARVLAGVVGDHLGWRAMYGIAAVLMVSLALLLRGRLPLRAPAQRLPYGKLMASLWDVLKTQPRLRRPSLVTALSFGSFTAFWTALPFVMAENFHRGATEAGLFGIVGLAGALLAPYAGRIADKRGATFTVTVALVLTVVSFGLMDAWLTIPALIVGVLLMDVGVQTVQVAEQGTVLALLPEARSRLNTLYMVTRFIGGAAGSVAGAYAWSYGRWPAVCAVAIGLNAAALAIHFAAHARKPAVVLPAEEQLSKAA
jgi:predicted MFS family arabinose efflux permease